MVLNFILHVSAGPFGFGFAIRRHKANLFYNFINKPVTEVQYCGHLVHLVQLKNEGDLLDIFKAAHFTSHFRHFKFRYNQSKSIAVEYGYRKVTD